MHANPIGVSVPYNCDEESSVSYIGTRRGPREVQGVDGFNLFAVC